MIYLTLDYSVARGLWNSIKTADEHKNPHMYPLDYFLGRFQERFKCKAHCGKTGITYLTLVFATVEDECEFKLKYL